MTAQVADLAPVAAPGPPDNRPPNRTTPSTPRQPATPPPPPPPPTRPPSGAVGRVRMARNVCWPCTLGRHHLCTGCDCCGRSSGGLLLVAVGAGTVAAAVLAVALLAVPFADWAAGRDLTLPLIVAGLLPLHLLVSLLTHRPTP